MTDKTATQNLTRTTSADDPMLTWDYLATLAAEVDRRMTAHAYDLGRSRRPPAAMVRLTTPYVSTNGRVHFDFVEFDTADLVDLSASDQAIKTNAPGYWVAGANLQCTGFGGNPEDTSISIDAFSDTVVSSSHNNLASGVLGISVSFFGSLTASAALTALATLSINFAGSGFTGPPTYTTIYTAELWAYKVREL